jgi:hypothetical protein
VASVISSPLPRHIGKRKAEKNRASEDDRQVEIKTRGPSSARLFVFAPVIWTTSNKSCRHPKQLMKVATIVRNDRNFLT